MRHLLPGSSFDDQNVSGLKVRRFHSAMPAMYDGLVRLPSTMPGLETLLVECAAFPDRHNDDQVDAVCNVAANRELVIGRARLFGELLGRIRPIPRVVPLRPSSAIPQLTYSINQSERRRTMDIANDGPRPVERPTPCRTAMECRTSGRSKSPAKQRISPSRRPRARATRASCRPAYRCSIKALRKCSKPRCPDCSRGNPMSSPSPHSRTAEGRSNRLRTTNPAGSAIVNAVGPIRQIVRSNEIGQRRYPVVVEGTPEKRGAAVQVQAQ